MKKTGTRENNQRSVSRYPMQTIEASMWWTMSVERFSAVDWRGDTTEEETQLHGDMDWSRDLAMRLLTWKNLMAMHPRRKEMPCFGIRLLSGINQQATNVTICAHVDINSAWIWFLMEEISTFKSVMCLTCHDKTGSVFSSAMGVMPFPTTVNWSAIA